MKVGAYYQGWNRRGFRVWADAGWEGVPLEDMLIYELHVATLTPEGSFEAIIPRLPARDEVVGDGLAGVEQHRHIAPGEQLDLGVTLPDCKYQIDLFCGEVLQSLNATRYGARLIDSETEGQEYCFEDKECLVDNAYNDPCLLFENPSRFS